MKPMQSLRKSGFAVALAALCTVPSLAQAALYITIVQGLGGQSEYDSDFTDSRQKIEAAAHSITDNEKVASFSGDKATRAALLKHFADITRKMTASDRAAIFLIGHGTFDGEVYKFNIPGPDLTGQDLKEVLEKLPGQNNVLVNTGSASGAMTEAITGAAAARRAARNPAGAAASANNAADEAPKKIAGGKYLLITATRNGNERNATHFGHYFAEALASRDADLNKNNSISLQEAFDFAEKRVNAYFQDEGKLSTEHAQLSGDGAAQINLARLNAAEQKAELANADAKLADLLKRRQQLDADLEELQLRRSQMNNTDYLAKFQQLVLQSAELNEQIDAAQKANGKPAGTAGDKRVP